MESCIRSRYVQAGLFTSNNRALRAMVDVGTVEAFRGSLSKLQLQQFDDQFRDSQLERLMTKELGMLDALRARYLTPFCDGWPVTRPAPTLFRVMGHINTGQHVGIVGSRNASSMSRHRARALGRLVARTGGTVVSGGALGIDIEALDSACNAGGRTLTVLGSGLLHPSPRQHIGHFRRYLDQGAIISTFKSDQCATRWTFVRRNRWISELSHSVVVIEARAGSGSLQAARHSLSLGRRVFVNGSDCHEPAYAGCAQLLSEGAQCLSVFTQELARSIAHRGLKPPVDAVHRSLLRFIGEGQYRCEKLSERLDLGFKDVLSSLIELESAGLVARGEGGRWYRCGLMLNRDKDWWLD
jgi:DNA processing protein